MVKRKWAVKVRRSWRIHPRTRIKPSQNLYRRARVKRKTREALMKEMVDEPC